MALTKEENKLIVEFLGGKYLGTERMDGHNYDMWDLPASFPMLSQQPDEFGMKRTGYLGFDTSWDWIMEVVARCFSLNGESGFGLFDASHFYKKDIIGICKSVLIFIGLYNSQKQ